MNKEKHQRDLAKRYKISYATVTEIANQLKDNDYNELEDLLEDYVARLEMMYNEWEWDDV